MNSQDHSNLNMTSVVGYGTFITKFIWNDKLNVEVCLIRDFIRVLPKGYWFPFVLQKKGSSFWALKFDVNKDELRILDTYEGVPSGLFNRIEIEVSLINNRIIKAFIYIPSVKTIKSEKLSPDIDKQDRWKEEIKKHPEIIKKFPELIT